MQEEADSGPPGTRNKELRLLERKKRHTEIKDVGMWAGETEWKGGAIHKQWGAIQKQRGATNK